MQELSTLFESPVCAQLCVFNYIIHIIKIHAVVCSTAATLAEYRGFQKASYSSIVQTETHVVSTRLLYQNTAPNLMNT